MATPKAKLAGLALIAVLFLLPCTSTAQQETEKPPAALEQSQGTAIEAPAPQSETPKPSDQQESPAAQPPPAAPVQSERPAEPPCDARCQAAEKRERDDLKAQQGMARYAKELADLTTWQIGVALIAIFLLGVTLYYTRKATSAATDAASAAGDVVRVTSETAERQLRAYMSIKELNMSPVQSAVHFKPIWQNTGSTPALRVRTHVNWRVFSPDIPDDFDFPDIAPDEGNDPASVGPGQHIFSWNVAIPNQDFRQAQSGSGGTLYVWGWADYDDVFPDTPRHRTEFCYQVVTDFRGGPAPKQGFGLRVHGPFNGADEDCYRQPATT